MHPGKRLRQLREQLGFTVRDVEAASARLASKRGDRAYSIPLSRLSDIENKEVVPSIFRVYSLAIIYRHDIREILSWYGVHLDEMAEDLSLAAAPKTHRIECLEETLQVKVPVVEDSSFDLSKSHNLGRLVQRWGTVPLAFIRQFENVNYTYAYVGSEDRTMDPILPPGSFIQVDESRDKVIDRAWRSEYDRPIYFLETREGYRCGWCRLQGGQLTLQPHPLSPEPVRMFRYPQEVDVIGEVVGIAMQVRRDA